MAMVKPTVKFKTYKQAAAVGGKIYGVANLADPVVPNVTMAEVIDYKKLHNYSADTLEALLSQVISGVADLVARDGRPRNLSDLLKFEPTIKGTFENLEQGVTNQKIVIRPRLLKEMRVNLPADAFSWKNENDSTAPKVFSLAWDTDEVFNIASAADWNGMLGRAGGPLPLTVAGERLAPSGFEAGMAYTIVVRRGENEYHLELVDTTPEGAADMSGAGCFLQASAATSSGQVLSPNAIKIPGTDGKPYETYQKAWYRNEAGDIMPTDLHVDPGDILEFSFTRKLAASDTLVTAVKRYTLGE